MTPTTAAAIVLIAGFLAFYLVFFLIIGYRLLHWASY